MGLPGSLDGSDTAVQLEERSRPLWGRGYRLAVDRARDPRRCPKMVKGDHVFPIRHEVIIFDIFDRHPWFSKGAYVAVSVVSGTSSGAGLFGGCHGSVPLPVRSRSRLPLAWMAAMRSQMITSGTTRVNVSIFRNVDALIGPVTTSLRPSAPLAWNWRAEEQRISGSTEPLQVRRNHGWS